MLYEIFSSSPWIRRKQIHPPAAAATVAGLGSEGSEDQTLLTLDGVSSLRMQRMHWNTEYYLCGANTRIVWKCEGETLPKSPCEQGMHVSVCAVAGMNE